MEIKVIQDDEKPAADYRKKSTRRSDVWQFMEPDSTENSKQVICTLCGLHLTASSRSGTSNLRNHLLNRHSDQYRPVVVPERAKRKYLGEVYSSTEDINNIEDEGATGAQATKEGGLADADGFIEIQGQSPKNQSRSADVTLGLKRGLGLPLIASSAAAKIHKRALLLARRQKANQSMNNLKKTQCTKSRSETVTTLIYRMLVEDLLPVSMIQGTGFRGLIDGMQTGYSLPTKLNIEERLNAWLEDGRSKLRARLSPEEKVGLTCDLWTDYENRNFITLTAHIITKEWKDESWILGTMEVNANATDEDVSEQMKSLCHQCGISASAIAGLVYGTDSKQPIPDTTERLKVLRTICAFFSLECRPCAGELLGISVQNALSVPPVAELIQDAGRLIQQLTTDSRHLAMLATLLKEHKQNVTLTVCDTSSGWLVISDTFTQLSKLKEMIATVLGGKKEVNLSDGQWTLLHEVIQALQGVKAAVAVMGDARNKSGSCWLPVMQGVLQHIESLTEADISEDGQVFRNTLASELKSRCELNEILPSSLMMQASAIDPRFHHLRFLSEDDRIPVIDELKQRLAENHKETERVGAGGTKSDPQDDSPFFALLGEDEFNKKSVRPEEEIDLFRLERPVSRETDPLNWWSLNQHRFPGLAKLARSILCVPVAASPLCKSDEVAAALENRKRLDHRHVDAQVFLHKNLNLFL